MPFSDHRLARWDRKPSWDRHPPASSWSRTASGMRGSLRRGIVGLLCSDHAQPPHEIPDSPGADSRFIVTNLPGLPKTLYDKVDCARGQAENLIKAHKLHLASDRTS